MKQKTLNRSECLIIAGLFGAGVGLCVTAHNAWGWIGGIGAWGLGEALRTRRQLEYADVLQGAIAYSQDALGDFSAVAAPVTRYVEKQRVEIVTAALRQLPLGDRLADSFVQFNGLSTDWFEGFEKRSAVVCGESGDGKTFLLNWRVQRFLESHPDGEIYICDPDYGSSHDGSEPNTWFDLPLEKVVQIETADIFNTILQIADTVSDRAKRTAAAAKSGAPKPRFAPLLLVIDEWVSFWDELDENQQELTLKALTNIINRGIKQGHVTFIAGLHDLAVGSSGMPQSLLRKVEILLLWRAAQSERNYNNLDVQKKSRDEAIAKISGLPKRVKELRPCAVFTDKQLTVKAIPHLQLKEIELVPMDERSPEQVWLSETWTPDLENLLLRRMIERTEQGKQAIALSEFWQLAGQSSRDQRNDNPRYALFREQLDLLKEQISTSPDQRGGRCPDEEPIDAVSEDSDFQESEQN